jgi:aspartyl/asparaginyl beta-hydroxylase (cupin superfamily)
MLKRLLMDLKNGERIDVNPRDDRDDTLWFQDGTWIHQTQNCISDTCNCISHDRFDTDEISRVYALQLIRDVVEYQEEKNQERYRNIEMLDIWISEAT